MVRDASNIQLISHAAWLIVYLVKMEPVAMFAWLEITMIQVIQNVLFVLHLVILINAKTHALDQVILTAV